MTQAEKKPLEKIAQGLWFDHQAEEAAKFYTSLFNQSEINGISHYGQEGCEFNTKEEGSVLTVSFTLEGLKFVALNGGPQYKFSPAVSYFVHAGKQEEIDALWKKLEKQGSVLMPLQAYPFSKYYGWLQDQFGLSWQLMLVDQPEAVQKITPSLLFVGAQAGKAKEAIAFYTSVFADASVQDMVPYDENDPPEEAGNLKYAAFTLNGQEFRAMDSQSEHAFSFNEANSFIIQCDSQEEIDHYWDSLSEGGDPNAQACGWLKDKYGVSWQVVPTILPKLMNTSDKAKDQRVSEALLQMKKLDIDTLKQA